MKNNYIQYRYSILSFFTQIELTIGDDDAKTLRQMATLFEKWSGQNVGPDQIIEKACKYSTNSNENTIDQTLRKIIVNYIYSVFNFQTWQQRRHLRSIVRKVSQFFNINKFALHLFEGSRFSVNNKL